MSTTTRTVRRSYEPESGTEFSMTQPSSVTFDISTPHTQACMLAKWIGSLPDFLARHSALPVVNLARPMNETAGQRQGTPLASYDRTTSSWRTYQVSLLTNTSSESLATWPRCGMIVNGTLSVRQTLVQNIYGKESGLWPTLTTRDYRNSSHRKRNTKAGPDLIGFLCLLIGEQGIRLKPSFAEAFQGFPIGWTGLRPLEMDGFRKWLKQSLK